MGARARVSLLSPAGRLTEAVRWTFQYNSGRMIALTRAVLATVFLLALWVDPDVRRPEPVGHAILGGYLLAALGLLLLSWRSWWWDYRLAWVVMVVDITIFLATVLLSEGGSDFTSPFLAFFAFLMLAATIRWDWRATVITGLAVTTLYLLLGLYMATAEPGFDIYRFGRRISYMLVMTLVLAWFGLKRSQPSVERFTEPPDTAANRDELIAQALGYAIAESKARRGALAWLDDEEPDVRIGTRGVELRVHRLGPEEFDPEQGFARDACLFDMHHGRSLVLGTRPRPSPAGGPAGDAFALKCGLREGVALPLRGLTGRGELLLADMPGLSVDHLALGLLLAREITAAFDRQATLSLAHESALAKARASLARDLHDTVAQSLAGTALRLEGLRTSIRNGRDAEAEIDSIKQSLREEQRHVRAVIARLRLGDPGAERVAIGDIVRPLMESLAMQWDIAVTVHAAEADTTIPASLGHEIGQIVREAVANAVRHGTAKRVDLAVENAGNALHIGISDDGRGFPDGQPGMGPWSIRGRLEKLGGKLHVSTGSDGTRLEISIPVGESI